MKKNKKFMKMSLSYLMFIYNVLIQKINNEQHNNKTKYNANNNNKIQF